MIWLLGQSLINGLLIGGVYALVAVGLTIIFGVMKIVNFAQGEFMMVGMYAAWLLFTAVGGSPYLLIVPVSVFMFIFGWLIYKGLVNPIVGKSDESYILLTVGLSYLLQNGAQLIWTTDYRSIRTPIRDLAIHLGSYSMQTSKLIAFLVAVVLVLVMQVILRRTDVGRAMRATSENSEVASMLGVNPVATYALAFSIGSVMAGMAGVLLTPMFYIFPRVGALFTITAFVVVVLGGLGNVVGALVGGLLIGVVESLTGSFVALDLAPVGTFTVFLLVLLLKPEGLFGGGGRRV